MVYLNVKINRWHCYQKFSFLYLEWRNPEPSFRPFRGVGFPLQKALSILSIQLRIPEF